MNKFLNVLQGICYVLIVIGAINWGLVGCINYNFVEALLGPESIFTKIIYNTIGIAAIVSLILTIRYTIENRDY